MTEFYYSKFRKEEFFTQGEVHYGNRAPTMAEDIR